MNFKKVVFILCCASPLLSLAKERKIDLKVDEWDNSTRSLPSLPVLTYDGNILYVYSDIPLIDIQIQIKDASGYVIHLYNTSILAGQRYSFLMDLNHSHEDYIVELIHGRKMLWGYFIIHENQ